MGLRKTKIVKSKANKYNFIKFTKALQQYHTQLYLNLPIQCKVIDLKTIIVEQFKNHRFYSRSNYG